jgi:hypothetical protein
MLSLGGNRVRLCEGVTRREWLRAGGLGTLGLTLPALLRGRAAADELRAVRATRATAEQGAGALRSTESAASFGRAKSCIVCFLFGAPAHQDVWDLKPDAPAEVRGEFAPIDTSVPGIRVGEHVPLLAAAAQHYALIRSVTHPDNTHTVAMHYMLTGRRHREPSTNPQNQPTDFPCFGAVAQKLLPPAADLPAGITLNGPANQVSANNHIFPGFFAGLLGSAHDPLFVSQDPSQADFRPFPSAAADEVPRYAARQALLDAVDGRRRELESVAGVRAYDEHFQRAFRLIASPASRDAFDLAHEPQPLRERYGASAFGQGCLLARRLVEAGVPLVTVNWARDDAFWDTHADNFRLLKQSLLPPFDRGFSALLEDLAQRGLLDETLVVCLGEFGRTPTINGAAGRDHWAACNTVLLAGAGARGGQVYGASDRIAALPALDPVSPDDLAATMYHALGLDPHALVYDALDRPLALALGRPLVELWS